MRTKARIGAKRYRMFYWLRECSDGLDEDALAEKTGLPSKLIRDQMSADRKDGFVELSDDQFIITDAGLDLLERFETYRRSKGLPLPTHSGPVGADDEDETQSLPPPTGERTDIAVN